MNVVAIIQARMSSSRLPGKVMQDIAGKPMLMRVVERVQRSSQIQAVCVATSTDPSDDPIEALCNQTQLVCYRGSMQDVLDRYFWAASTVQAEVIVRVTADCPLLDPKLIDVTLEIFNQTTDFAANRLPPPWKRSFPIGLDLEVCSFSALERAWKEATQTYQREHVMPYLYEGVILGAAQPLGQPVEPNPSDHYYVSYGTSKHGFKIAQLHHRPDYGALRWTVDTPADLELVRQVYNHFAGRHHFSWQEILTLFERKPELALINADVTHKTAFDVDERALKD